MDNLIVNSNEGAEVYGDMGWEGAGPYARLPSEGNFYAQQAPELWAREVRSFLTDPGV